MEERALPGPRAADDSDHIPELNLKGELLEHVELSPAMEKTLRELIGVEERSRRLELSRRGSPSTGATICLCAHLPFKPSTGASEAAWYAG